MNDIFSIYTVNQWSPFDSYGLVACQTALELWRRGLKVNAFGLGAIQTDGQSAEVRAITERPICPDAGGLALGWPAHFHALDASFWRGPKVALTMFESSKLPKGWTDILNQMDAVITPSRFCAQLFKAEGVTVPIHLAPLGISSSYDYVARPLRFNETRPLTFLAFLDQGERKGGEVALKSFIEAFGNDPGVKLILKSRPRAVPFKLLNPNIETIFADYDEMEMADLYQRCDVLVNPHKGEGFGLIPREFAATGGLALTTDWSGTADHLDEWGLPLPYTLEKAGWTRNVGLEGQDLGYWAKLDYRKVADSLRAVRVSFGVLQRSARARSSFVHDTYSWRGFVDALLAIWQGVSQRQGVLL